MHPPFVERNLWNIDVALLDDSVRSGAGELDHLSPFLCFLGDPLSEVGG
jgi:hypothetical protein